MLVAARDAQVQAFVYAASSSTYGDHPDLPKVEDRIGNPLSPYAVTKYVNGLYAVCSRARTGSPAMGLRYFNVFGKRQDPDGAYAAVIPKWTAAMIMERGRRDQRRDGQTSQRLLLGGERGAGRSGRKKNDYFRLCEKSR